MADRSKRALLRLVLCGAALVGSSCAPRAGAPPQIASAPAGSATLLNLLRERLDTVRARPVVNERFENWRDEDLRPLMGLSRTALEQALGSPEGCRMEGARPDCRDGEWMYSFYALPPGSLGGGPELVLEFDARGVATAASWWHSK